MAYESILAAVAERRMREGRLHAYSRGVGLSLLVFIVLAVVIPMQGASVATAVEGYGANVLEQRRVGVNDADGLPLTILMFFLYFLTGVAYIVVGLLCLLLDFCSKTQWRGLGLSAVIGSMAFLWAKRVNMPSPGVPEGWVLIRGRLCALESRVRELRSRFGEWGSGWLPNMSAIEEEVVSIVVRKGKLKAAEQAAVRRIESWEARLGELEPAFSKFSTQWTAAQSAYSEVGTRAIQLGRNDLSDRIAALLDQGHELASEGKVAEAIPTLTEAEKLISLLRASRG